MYSPIFKIILLTMVLYKTTEAVLDILPREVKPLALLGQPGCYIASLEVVLQIGVPFSPQDGSCEQYVCNHKGITKRYTCDAKVVGEGCEEIEGDKYAPYPACCSVVRCPDEEDIEY